MPANFISNPHKGAGHGIINAPQVSCTTEPTFAIYRASDGLCLAPGGWQNSEVYLAPNEWDCDSNNLRMTVDASVVDQLDALDTYKLLIKDGTNAPVAQTLIIDDIVYSSMHGGQGIGGAPHPAPIPKPEPMPEPMPEPEPEPIAPVEEEPLPEIAPEQKKSIFPIVITVIIILLLGVGLWWFLQNKAEQASPEQTEQAEQAEQKADPAATNPEPTPEASAKEPEQAPSTPVLSPMQQTREFLRKDNTGTASLDLAKNLSTSLDENASEESLDAIFLLLEDAAQKNIPAAMLSLAKYYDPNNTDPKGSIIPDAREAYTWYKKALDNGEAEASKRLEALHTWLQEAAKGGSKQAEDLLKQWK